MPDPTAPGWRPEYTGDDSLGEVATDGKRLGAHLYALYRAGRNELPALAATYASLTRRIHGITGTMHSQFDRPVRGPDQSHLRLLELRDCGLGRGQHREHRPVDRAVHLAGGVSQ